MVQRIDHAAEVKRLLVDPWELCGKLGLAKDAKRQAGGLLVLCPAHQERTPSCSVTIAQDGGLRVRCFGCDWSGDALSLVGQVYGLTLRNQRDFVEVLALGAELGGDIRLADEIRAGTPDPERPRPAPRAVTPIVGHARPYPDSESVLRVWTTSGPCGADADAWEALRARGIDPDAVDLCGVARVIPLQATNLPRWARYRGEAERSRPWTETGHRLVLPMFDPTGALRSVRAWRIDGDDSTPKRLPPAGCKATGLVMANRLALMMLKRRVCPVRLVFVEGEPDFLTWCSITEDAVIGVVNRSWNEDFARAVPGGTRVYIRTHNDEAGDKYAEEITQTIIRKCPVWRAA